MPEPNDVLSAIRDSVRAIISARFLGTLVAIASVLFVGQAAVVSFIVQQTLSGLQQNIAHNMDLTLRIVERLEGVSQKNAEQLGEFVNELASVKDSLAALDVSINTLNGNIGSAQDELKLLGDVVAPRTLLGILAGMRDLNTFAGYVQNLSGDDNFDRLFSNVHFYTVFAPSDEAIRDLPMQVRERFENHERPANRDLLTAFVLSHFVSGHYQAADFFGRTVELETTRYGWDSSCDRKGSNAVCTRTGTGDTGAQCSWSGGARSGGTGASGGPNRAAA